MTSSAQASLNVDAATHAENISIWESCVCALAAPQGLELKVNLGRGDKLSTGFTGHQVYFNAGLKKVDRVVEVLT